MKGERARASALAALINGIIEAAGEEQQVVLGALAQVGLKLVSPQSWNANDEFEGPTVQ